MCKAVKELQRAINTPKEESVSSWGLFLCLKEVFFSLKMVILSWVDSRELFLFHQKTSELTST